MNKTQVRQEGYARGYSIAKSIDTVDIGEYIDGHLIGEGLGKVKITSDNWIDVHTTLAYEGESVDREYSPFEFLANDLNELSDSDRVRFEPWNEFEEAIGRGIAKALRERYKAVCWSKMDYFKSSFDGSRDMFETVWRRTLRYARESELDLNENLAVERVLEEITGELVNDSSSRFYIYG